MVLLDLFRPKWKHSDSLVRKTAVEQLADQALLREIARTDPDGGVRRVAAERLSDQTVLADIARTDNDDGVREAARSRVQLLVSETRKTEVAGLADQTQLGEIARTDPDSGLRRIAATRLSDHAVLADIAETDSDDGVREAARTRLQFLVSQSRKMVASLKDQTKLGKIAKTDRDSGVRRIAAERLSDQAVLAEIAETDSDDGVREAARSRLQFLVSEADRTDQAEQRELRRRLSGSYVWEQHSSFTNVVSVTETACIVLKLSRTAHDTWERVTGGAFDGPSDDLFGGNPLLKAKEITENLSLECAACERLFEVVSMTSWLKDGRIRVRGREWQLSTLNSCPVCGNGFVWVRVNDTGSLYR